MLNREKTSDRVSSNLSGGEGLVDPLLIITAPSHFSDNIPSGVQLKRLRSSLVSLITSRREQAESQGRYPVAL